MHSDTLSDILRAIRLSGGMFFRVHASAPYAVSAAGVEEIAMAHAPGAVTLLPFHLVTRGPVWFDVGDESHRLNDGEIIVLPHGAAHSLTHQPGTRPTPIAELQHAVSGDPPTLRVGGAGMPTETLCGFLQTEGRLFNPLVDALPEVLVVRGDDERAAWLAATLERAFNETLRARPGASALVGRLTELLFIEIIQRYVAEGGGRGWLAGLGDPVVGAALALLHSAPERQWSVDELAAAVGASRSMLSDRFTELIGLSPIRYLTAWRMELAGQRLVSTADSLAEIAIAAGYESEAAFKRHAGEPPATWRRHQRVRAGMRVIAASPNRATALAAGLG